MSPSSDDHYEMFTRRSITDADVEASLAGSPTDPDLIGVAAFAGRVRRVAELEGDVRMSPELATVLSRSVSFDDREALTTVGAGEPSAPFAARSGSVARKTSVRVTRFVAGLSIAGKVMFGTGVAAAAVGGVAAAGALPAPAQEAAAAVVRTVTPFEISGGGEAPDDPPAAEAAEFGQSVRADATGEPGADGTAVSEAAKARGSATTADDDDPPDVEAAEFGRSVRADATGDDGEPGVDGTAVSEAAKALHDDERCTNVPDRDDLDEADEADDLEEADEADGAGGEHGCKPDTPGKPAGTPGPSVPARPADKPPISVPPGDTPPTP